MVKDSRSIDSLLRLDLPTIRRAAEAKGYTLSSLEDTLSFVDVIGGEMYWTRGEGANLRKLGELSWSCRKEEGRLFLYLDYILRQKDTTSKEEKRVELVRRPSNLKPGTSRYYFADQNGNLFTKLYLLDGTFYTRTELSALGLLYSVQKMGHTERYVWNFSRRVPNTWRRCGKTHYRGKITPGYERYCRLVKEADRRFLAELSWRFPNWVEDWDGGDGGAGDQETTTAPPITKEDYLRQMQI